MPTRPRSSSYCAAAAIALAVAGFGQRVCAQPRRVDASARDEGGARENYGFARWGAAGASHAGVALGRFTVPGLTLRARTDRMPGDGGITLSYGAPSRTTLQVVVAVTRDAASAREVLIGRLRAAQATLSSIDDRQGADVAFGDSASAHEAAAAVFGNIAVWIARTSDAGPETPSAASVLLALRIALAPTGAPTFTTPTLVLAPARSSGRVLHVDVSGGSFEHVDVRVRGGHLRGVASPAGLDVVPSGRGAVEIRVIATDPLGRSGQRTLFVTPPGAVTRS